MKKVLNVLKNIVVWLVVAIAVFMMIFTVVSVQTFDRNDRSIFGLKVFVVQSDSMRATDFSKGDIVLVKDISDAEKAQLEAGNIITFISLNPGSVGETVTHKIRKVTTNDDGEPGFVTYGTTTDTDDATIVTYGYIVGKYTGHVPKIGYFFLFLKTTPGYIVCIFVPFLLLILYHGVNVIRLFRRYKNEQTREMEAERQKLEEERRQSLEMMAQLQALQEKLEKQQQQQSGSGEDSCAGEKEAEAVDK